jgi:phage terminase large subunit GpA-like protein
VTDVYGGGGVPKKQWVMRTGVKHNEALDIRVYNIAARYSLGRMSLEKLAARLSKQIKQTPQPDDTAVSINTIPEVIPPQKPNKYDKLFVNRPQPSGWMSGIR